jgi:hypothetical protein
LYCGKLYLCETNQKTNTMNTQLNEFKAAKQIALTINKGLMRRAKLNGIVTNYVGYKSANGKMYVIGDTENDIQNADAIINGCPAREIFGEFSVMAR